MAYNPGVQDRSGEILAQGISQGFSSLTQGVERYSARKEKEQNILSEARGRGRALRSTIKGLESLNILPAGMSDDLTRAEENSSPRDFLAKVNETSDRIGGLITGGIEMNRISADRAEKQQKIDEEKRIGTIVGQLYNEPDNAKKNLFISQLPPLDFQRVIAGMKNLADINKPAPQRMTQKQMLALKDAGMSFKGTPVDNEMFDVTEVGAFAPPSQVNVNNAPESKMKVIAYEALSKRKNEEITKMLAAKPQIEAMSTLLDAVGEKEIVSGSLADLELGAKQFINKAAGRDVFKNVSATEQYLANSVVQIGQLITAFGSGTGLSDKDADLARKGAGGELSVTRETLKELNRIAKLVFTKKLELFNDSVSQTFKGENEDNVFARDSLFVPEAQGRFAPSLAEQARLERERRAANNKL